MYGARFAVLVIRARVLPSPSHVICRSSRCSPPAVTLLFEVVVALGLVRVGLNFPLNGTCANVYAHVVVVRVHVWRTVCSVCATGARVVSSDWPQHPGQMKRPCMH